MKLITTIAITLAIFIMATPSLSVANMVHVRNKRGLSNFFKRFWNIRKKINYSPFQQQSSFYPSSLGQDYLLSQASNFYPIYQMNQASQAYPLLQQQYPQIYGESNPQNQQNQIDYQGYQQSGNNQQLNLYNQQQSMPSNQQSASYSNPNYQPIQPDESVQKPSYYYPNQHYVGTSPYTFHSNPSQANTFHSQPYGSNPGTIDVHQVLDQFIRSAGLSPQGDHENANKDRAYTEDNKALSVKKLYSYPFYFSSSGDRPTSIRRQSTDETFMDKPMFIKRINQSSIPKLESVTDVVSKIPEMADESSFIAKNAAALQDFLVNKANNDPKADVNKINSSNV